MISSKGGRRKGEGGRPRRHYAPAGPAGQSLARRFPFPPSHFAKPSAFTLVELLVATAIVAILAGLSLGVAAVAAESGRAAKTKQMITRLHTLVMEHYDTFRDKRVDLQDSSQLGVALAQLRLRASRERMKMEMPDRWSDFLVYDLKDGLPDPANDLQFPAYLNNVPALAQVYRAQYARIYRQYQALASPPSENDFVQQLVSNEGAECLYMIVVFATGDGESRGLFKESDFADTDGDGALEILDGWGNPIQFLRWAPGFESELQLSFSQLSAIQNAAESGDGDADVVNAVTADHDPLDLFRVDQPLDSQNVFAANAIRGFRLVPLIYSGGRDEDSDLATGRLQATLVARNGSGNIQPTAVDPYFVPSVAIGGANDDNDGVNFVDNITNHLIASE